MAGYLKMRGTGLIQMFLFRLHLTKQFNSDRLTRRFALDKSPG